MNRIWKKALALVVVFTVISPIAVSAGAITQGYQAASDIPKGAIVSLKSAGSQQVEKANIANDGLLVGVVTDGSNSLVDVLPAGSQVRVATSGDVTMLVSNVNGDIKSGARLIASPLSGIATVDYPPAPGVKYIAVANSDFNANSKGATKISVSQSNGTKKDVYVGVIPAKLFLGDRTPGTGDNNILTKIGRQVTGKSVNILQVIAAGAVFITALGLSGMILQSSIRGSFVSMGRNPLAKDTILTGLVRVVAIAILIFGAGMVVSYLILQV